MSPGLAPQPGSGRGHSRHGRGLPTASLLHPSPSQPCPSPLPRSASPGRDARPAPGAAADLGGARVAKLRTAGSLRPPCSRNGIASSYKLCNVLQVVFLLVFFFFTLIFLRITLCLTTCALASLQICPRKVTETEKPDRRKPAEITHTDKACTGFPIHIDISAAGLEVLISQRNVCSSSLLSAFLSYLHCFLLRAPCSLLSASTKQPLFLGSAQHLSMQVISSLFSKTLSHMLTFNYVLKPRTCELA